MSVKPSKQLVVKHLLHERSNEHVLVHDIKRREHLGTRQDVLSDAVGETLLYAAGLGQHARKDLTAVPDHVGWIWLSQSLSSSI